VERALSREAIQDALGQHTPGVLPTVDELIDAIANVEIQAIMRRYAVDDDLLGAAWYLHGVASATQAAQLYSLPRQRRAFAVSAHIFDLALNDPSRGRYDRLTLAFAAQVGYRRSGLDPNATAVYRRVVDLLDDSTDVIGQIDTLALEAGVAFLGLEPARLGRLQRLWRHQLADLAAEAGVPNLQSTMFGPAEQVLLATSALLAYLRTGDTSQLEVASIALISVVDLSAGEGDHDARWVAAHLVQITYEMTSSSVWAVLPPGTPAAVAQAFTVGAPTVLTLWPPQRELLTRASMNPLDPATGRLLLSVPTSAGKTLLAQVMICTHLATQNGDVCYVTPLRSLGREMRQALHSRLRVLNRELGPDIPDFATASVQDLLDLLAEASRGDVEVMTPERLMQQLRRDPQGVLDRFSLFVIDEAHLLAQPERGFLLESLLAFLTTTSSARLVLLSGVLGNAASLASWLAPAQSEVLYTSDWRGPRRMHALLYTEAQWDQEVRTARGPTAHLPVRATFPLIGKLIVRPAEGKAVALVTEPLGTLALNKSADGSTSQKDKGDSTPNYQMVATAASALLHAGSLLMIVSTRTLAASSAHVLAETLPQATTTTELVAFLEERLGASHPLIDCVRHGVAYHHAGLPIDVLNAIEEAIRSDQLRALVATSTLTDGVNLPVRTVLISETTYEGQRAGNRLDAPRLLNAIGRAGRAGQETEGWIVLALHKEQDTADFRLLTPEASTLEAKSTLLSADALTSLAEAEALLADTADAILRLPPGPATDFASYVWFALTALEQLRTTTTGDALTAVQHLLGFAQMDPELHQRWARLAAAVQDTYIRTDPERRRRWTTTGTSLGSAARLDRIVDQLVAHILRDYPGTHDEDETAAELSVAQTLQLLDTATVFDALLGLPEAKKAWQFRARRNGGRSLVVPIAPALASWLAGADIALLADQILSPIADASWRLEHTVDAVSATFEHYLSWMSGVVVEQANLRLATLGARVLLRQDIAALIRYGVDTPQALALLTRGMQSRRLAHRLGRLAEERDLNFDDLRDWLAQLGIQGWRTDLAAGPREILDLLELTRARQQSLLRTLLGGGAAEVTVRRTDAEDDRGDGPRTVDLQAPTRGIAEIAVFYADRQLAVVTAQNHADVLDVLTSGLDITAVLVGDSLTLTADI